jgi:acetyl-CoA decarbonylase/synthase, CODH/ACS complex subunit gamma
MALSGLDIYKLLPKTNCRECGFATCLAFAMQLAKKAVSIDKCPSLSEEAKKVLKASSEPPIRLVTIGDGESRLEAGNETVMFRHEEKFHRPCGIGFVIEDSLSDAQIRQVLEKINRSKFERVGQELKVNLVALRQTGDAERFAHLLELVIQLTPLPLALICKDAASLNKALEKSKGRRPLVYRVDRENLESMAPLLKEYNVPAVVSGPDLGTLAQLTKELNSRGVQDLFLEARSRSLSGRIWDLTQIRRQALKGSNRALGYPTFVLAEEKDPFEEALTGAVCISKYASLILISGTDPWEVLSLLTLRQNIYTDPQKPLQIEPKLYAVGQVSEKSPVLITTNFSLSYYTVLGEVEASKVPSYILSVDTEGMSVLTAWAAEKFTPDKISSSLEKAGAKETVSHKSLILPGYVAVMSGELEECSGWKVIVGPKEAAGLPSFLKTLNS